MKKIFRWAGYALLTIIIFLFAIFLNWESISYFTLRKVVQFYAGRADIKLDIGVISGDPFSETNLGDVYIRPDKEGPPAYHFKARSITCTYNLWDLKQGFEIFLQGLNCTADSPEFTYDLRAAEHVQPAGEQTGLFIPALLPGIDLRNGTVVLHDAAWEADIRNLNGTLRSAAEGQQLQLEVEQFRYSREGITRIETGFNATVRYADEMLSIDGLEIGGKEIWANGFVDLSRMEKDYIEFAADITFTQSRLNLKGSWAGQLLQTNIRTDNFDIGELLGRLGGTGWDVAGKIRGEAALTVNLERLEDLEGTFAVTVNEAKLYGVDVESASAAGSFDSEIFKVSAAEARTPGNRILVKDVSVATPLLLEDDPFPILGGSQAEFQADITDFAAILQLLKVEKDVFPEATRPDSATIKGYLEKGILHIEDGRAVNADFNLTVERVTAPVPAANETYESVPLDLAVRLESSSLQSISRLFGDIAVNGQAAADVTIAGSIMNPATRINLTGENLSFYEKQLGELSLQGDIRLNQEKLGRIKSIEFEITELTQENNSGLLTLLSPASADWQDGIFSGTGVFQLDGKGEIATGVSREPGKEITVEIITRSLDSEGWLGNYIDNRYFFRGADIEAVLKGLFENTQVKLAGRIDEAGTSDIPFPLTGSLNLHYSPGGIEIAEFNWKSHARNQLSITGFVPYDPMAEEPFLDGNLVLDGHMDFPALEDIAVFLEPWGIGRGSVVLDLNLTGSWNRPEGNILLQAEGLESPYKMRKFIESPVNIAVDIEAQGENIELKSGSFESIQYAAQATGSWLHGVSVKELLRNRRADLKGEVTAEAKVKLKDLNFLNKYLPWLRRLEGDMQGEIRLAGPVTDPAFNGSFSLKDGEASHTFNFPILTAINLAGDFDERSISITDMRAEVGGSPVNLNGKVTGDQGKVDFSLQINGKNVLLFRNNDMRLRGDVQLDVSGPLERLAVKGTTGLTSGYYTRDLDLLGMVGSSSAPVSKGVSFLFSFTEPPLRDAVLDIKITAIEPFRIRNNVIRGALRPELTLKGTGELPYLLGTVYIDPSRVLLPSGRLQVKSGLLRFLEGEPDRPQLDLLAQSKILGYDINVVTQGPLDDPVITLSSSPALPNDELLLLLLTGQPPKKDAKGSLEGKGTSNVMVYLGRDFFNRWLEDESGAGDETILDRFELDFGRDITKSGEQTIESSFRLSRQVTGTGQVYYLTGEKDRYDAYNYGLKLVFRFE